MGRKPKNQINQTENQDQPIIEEENLVKKTCRELGITQKELAERIGVSRQTVSDWATGRVIISKSSEYLLSLLLIEQEYIEFKKAVKDLIPQTVIPSQNLNELAIKLYR